MDFELFVDAVNQASESASARTVITAVGLGEPLMYRRLSDALAYLATKCPDLPISMDTNGTLLDTKNSQMLCSYLTNARDVLLVSLNSGSRNSYIALNKVDKFDLVVRNIHGFLETRRALGRGPRLGIQILDSRITAHEIEDFRRYWEPIVGPRDLVSVKPLDDWGGRVESRIAREHTDARREIPRYPCLSPWILAFIHVDGSVYPCCQALAEGEKSELVLGHIGERELREICSGTKIREIKEQQLKGNWNAFRDCRRCATYATYPNIWLKVMNRWR
jgi:radical SAM protein with 4Fe4S-binding SPASM domain